MRHSHRNKQFIGIFALLALLSPELVLADIGDTTISVDAQPLAAALQEFSDQSGLQIAYVATLADNKTSRGTRGAATPTVALDEMLDGTGLAHQFVNDDTVAIGRSVAGEGSRISGNPHLRTGQVLMAQNQTSAPQDPAMTSRQSSTEEKRWYGVRPLDEIIVTSQKREQSIQRVPISISAYSQEDLFKLRATEFSGFADSVPGMGFATTGLGGARYFIRGVGQVTVGQSPTTGVYLDEVPLQVRTTFGISSFEPQLFDVNRIEVLRGPQGTLYGSSALGGAVRIITNKPDATKFEGKFEGGMGSITDGGNVYNVSAAINLPLIENKLALRVVGTTRDRDGWIDDLRPRTNDVFENQNNDSVVLRDVNTQQVNSIRATLRYTPDDTLSITPAIMYQEGNADGMVRDFTDLGLGLESRTVTRFFETIAEEDVLIASLDIEKQLDWFGGMSVFWSGSFYDREMRSNFDVSPFSNGGINGQYPPPQGLRLRAMFDHPQDNEQISQELRLMSDSDSRLQWVAGVYYKDVEQQDVIFRNIIEDFGAGAEPILSEQFTTVNEEELALFGEVNYSITDDFTMTFGGRLFNYDIIDERIRYGRGGRLRGTTDYDFIESASESGFSPRVIMSYAPNDDLNFYTSYSEGFRTGGVNAPILDNQCTPAERAAAGIPDVPPPFESDTTKNLEVGAKTYWFDNRLTLNLSVYDIQWQDYQQSIQEFCGVVSGTTAVIFTTNAGEVSTQGLEIEFDIQPLDRLSIKGGSAYIDARFEEAVPMLGLAAGASLLDVPRWSHNLQAEYAFPFTHFGLGSDTIAYYFAKANYVASTLSGFGEGDAIERPSYTLVDFSVGLSGDSWDLSLFIDNVTDEIPVYAVEYATSPNTTNAPGWFAATVGQPRTVGVRFSRNWGD